MHEIAVALPSTVVLADGVYKNLKFKLESPIQHTLSLGYPTEVFSSEVHPWDYPRTMCAVWAAQKKAR